MAQAAGAALAIQAIGTIGSTMAQANAADAQAQAAEQEAISVKQASESFERQARRRSGLIMGQSRAIVAASGIDPSSRSAVLLDLDNARQAEIEALDIRRFGQVSAAGKRYQGTLAKASIPGIYLGGAAQGGSILSTWATRGGTVPSVFAKKKTAPPSFSDLNRPSNYTD